MLFSVCACVRARARVRLRIWSLTDGGAPIWGPGNPLWLLSLPVSAPATLPSVDYSLPTSLQTSRNKLWKEWESYHFSWLCELHEAEQLDLTHFSF